MSIITKTCAFLQLTKIVFPKKVHKLLEFGFKTLSLQRIVSLNSNARSVIENTHTAESKIYRLTKNSQLANLFPKLLVYLKVIQSDDLIAVDFSDFNGIQILLFAKQTQQGRTIPLYFEQIIYPIEKDSQNIFIIKAIKNFLKIIDQVKVSLVFDRGFACPGIIQFLAKNKVNFYIRIKKNKSVLFNQQLRHICSLPVGACQVSAYDQKLLSLTITPKPRNSQAKNNEPWYIISNDLKSNAKRIQEIYYYRFEIEELFKDAKRIFGLEYIKFKKVENFITVLWFVIFGIWFIWYLHEVLAGGQRLMKKLKDRYGQSIIHYWLERIKFALTFPVLSKIRIDSS